MNSRGGEDEPVDSGRRIWRASTSMSASCEIEDLSIAYDRIEQSKKLKEELRIIDFWLEMNGRLHSQNQRLEDEEMPRWFSASNDETTVTSEDDIQEDHSTERMELEIQEDHSTEKMEPEKGQAKEIVAALVDSEAKWLQISTKAFAESSNIRPDFQSEYGFLNCTIGR
ncbi:hypothetical protein MPTK1_3g09730 [Marchantia polymorpha subsp. ruderalis]|uniref:Uncharacterized protein n=2 Tax=Marchantia polymorpha TaxID=3197 RepID=A0AAF6AZ48_MARPO|nr:hypothetical protein MARPO_0085s0055 [Marchantia polymorpha]BBN05032.1 hypothetical protein Mp_3g09730 [Marchantia polymorpha subsp. ruderalis]|eukprot:PTQ33843.1 hypothetical protein MARPO_0085s0055 [Marchantia polymorpha]